MDQTWQMRVVAYASEQYRAMVDLRTEILRSHLATPFTEEELAEDAHAIHLGCLSHDETLMGCLVLHPQSDAAIRMRQVAVSYDARNLGIGRELVVAAEKHAREQGFARMVLHAREPVVGFYEKLGYRVTSELFIEVEIPHRAMEKDL